MNGLECTQAAEKLLDGIDVELGLRDEDDDRLAVASVYAQLAIAGGIGALVRTLQRVLEPRDGGPQKQMADELAEIGTQVERLVDRVAAIPRVSA